VAGAVLFIPESYSSAHKLHPHPWDDVTRIRARSSSILLPHDPFRVIAPENGNKRHETNTGHRAAGHGGDNVSGRVSQ
jgi:hypothetical protein